MAELVVDDDPAAWERLGFALAGDDCRIGTVPLRFAPTDARRGIAGWVLRDIRSAALDGLPTSVASPNRDGEPGPPPAHANGALAIDHLVVFSPDFERSLAAFETAGLPLRRVTEIGVKHAPVRRGFFRLGEVILELVDQRGEDLDPAGPAVFWGMVVSVADLDGLHAGLGERASPIRGAVQPGRRIAPLRREAGLSLPVAFMTPEPREATRAPVRE